MKDRIVQEDIERIWDRLSLNELAGKELLLTGGTGMIGSYLLYTLKKWNEGCGGGTLVHLVVHNDIPGFLSFVEDADWVHVIKGDLSDDSFCRALPKADYIIHAAGYGQPGRFLEDKLKTIRMNTMATDILLSKLLRNGKFLFVSTSELYSGSDKLPYHENEHGCTTPQHARGCYIEGKRCGEAICTAYRGMGSDVKIARVSLAYGPCIRRGDRRVLNEFIEKAAQGTIQLLDDGVARRTYCYVSDTVDLLWNILLKGTGPVYNVGGGSETSIFDLAEMIARRMGADVVRPKSVSDSQGAPKAVGVNIDKAKAEFGKREFVSLDEGLDRTIRWFKQEYQNQAGPHAPFTQRE